MIFRKCWGVNGCLELFRKFILLVGTGFPYLGWTLKKTDEQRHRGNKQERENRRNKQERESEGEVKRGRLIGWKSGITPLLGQGSCGKQALCEEVWGKYLTFCQSHTNWILYLYSGVLPWLHMFINGWTAAVMSTTTSDSVSWKAALWAREDDVRSFLFTPLLQRAIGIHLSTR